MTDMIVERVVKVKDYVIKSNLPASDFVINPYVGCPHACKYCYACFMKRFTGHKEPWGSFLDIKQCEKPLNAKRLEGKSVFLSSVTDCYNKYEEKYCITQKILQQLVDIDCWLAISTKSKLIQRDIKLLKRCRHLTVSMSINTLDETFRAGMDCASTIQERLETLQILHDNGIHTILFMSPIFPVITNFQEIVERSKAYVDEYWFENLNLRGSYKQAILSYIAEKYPHLNKLYESIYMDGNKEYWISLAQTINDYCEKYKIKYTNYFYHSELVKEKLARKQ